MKFIHFKQIANTIAKSQSFFEDDEQARSFNGV
jgi:hypothetical protein